MDVKILGSSLTHMTGYSNLGGNERAGFISGHEYVESITLTFRWEDGRILFLLMISIRRDICSSRERASSLNEKSTEAQVNR